MNKFYCCKGSAIRNNYWPRNLIGHYPIWVLSPRNSTLYTRLFLSNGYGVSGAPKASQARWLEILAEYHQIHCRAPSWQQACQCWCSFHIPWKQCGLQEKLEEPPVEAIIMATEILPKTIALKSGAGHLHVLQPWLTLTVRLLSLCRDLELCYCQTNESN